MSCVGGHLHNFFGETSIQILYSLLNWVVCLIAVELFLLFSCSVVSHSLQPHGLQHTRLSCPSLSIRVRTNSRPLSWCSLTISSYASPFSFCIQSFPVSGSFPMSWVFPLGSQSIGASVSASVFPMNIQHWSPLGLTSLISFQFKGLSRIFSSTTIQRHPFFCTQPSLWSNSYIHTWLTWLLKKP